MDDHPTRQAADRAAVLACIQRCARAPDERGRSRAELKCVAELAKIRPGRVATTAAAAAAARRIGAWLAGAGTP